MTSSDHKKHKWHQSHKPIIIKWLQHDMAENNRTKCVTWQRNNSPLWLQAKGWCFVCEAVNVRLIPLSLVSLSLHFPPSQEATRSIAAAAEQQVWMVTAPVNSWTRWRTHCLDWAPMKTSTLSTGSERRARTATDTERYKVCFGGRERV